MLNRLVASLGVAVCLLALHTSALAAPATPQNPPWCKVGFHCIPQDLRAEAESASCEDRPWWAPTGWGAVPTACLEEATVRIRKLDLRVTELEGEGRILKATRRRFGGIAGCGAGPAWIVSQDEDGRFSVPFIPVAPACIVGYGFRWGG